jgi:hypothetical protein
MESETVAFLLELDERLKKDRAWIRDAEFFHAREGAEYVDGLRASVQKAIEMYRSGHPVAARLELRGEE